LGPLDHLATIEKHLADDNKQLPVIRDILLILRDAFAHDMPEPVKTLPGVGDAAKEQAPHE
jgi:hypothetical protein